MTTGAHHVWIVAYDQLQALDLTGPHEVFAAANRVADGFGTAGPRYTLHVVGPAATADTPVTTESGLRIMIDPLPRVDDIDQLDTVLIPGGDGARQQRSDSPVVRWAAAAGARAHRIATVCTGAFIAAEAGLLDGRRVTTHWARSRRLAARFPDIDVDPDSIYIKDGTVWTSAGVTSGIDLALAMVEHDLGSDVAQEVARWLVVFLRRPGGQSQFAPPVWSRRSGDGPIRHAQELIDTDPAAITSITHLASEVGLSARHFSRLFTEQLGETPNRYLERVRVTAARQQLEATTDGLPEVAQRCGLGTSETLRRVFQRHLGVSPNDYRKRFTQLQEN